MNKKLKWLRDVHNIHVEVFCNDEAFNPKKWTFCYTITSPRKRGQQHRNWDTDAKKYKTHEECTKAGIKKALELLKSKK